MPINALIDRLVAAEGGLRLHLVGVAGSGMSGLAQLLLEMGHQVSGSDRVSTLETERLTAEGMTFCCLHRGAEIGGRDGVIYSSAIRPDNPCLVAARELGVPVLRRAECLAALMRSRQGVVVAGTHGKTTTSSMLAHLLRRAGMKPSHYIGAEIPLLGRNACFDPEGQLFVAEGDESDGTLTHYLPQHSIILNIEADHLDYYKSLDEIVAVFRSLVEATRGTVIYCRADRGALELCGGRANAVSYGWDGDSDYSAQRVELGAESSQFTLVRRGEALGRISLGIPGRHNVLNASAALASALEAGAEFEPLVAALAEFRGANRRFQVKGGDPARGIRLFDDYGHHPTEVAATLETARRGRPGRLLAVFQPHRYTRTQALAKEFGPALALADQAWITDIYPASEDPLPGVTGQLLVDEAQRAGIPAVASTPSLTEARWAAGNALQDGDLLLTLGAGHVHEVITAIARDLDTLAQLRASMQGEPGKLKLYEPMRRHTTLLVGGPAQFWAEPETEAGFIQLLQGARARGLPVFVIGRGSNLLVRDGGIPGLVIHPAKGEFARIEIDGQRLECGVGARLKAVANAALKAGLGGFEWMEGIPGQVGGALRMNAGAMDGETFGQVQSVRVVAADGRIETRTPEQLAPRYRSVEALGQEFALSAVFFGHPARAESIQAGLDASKDKRRTSQPQAASAGCIFKNPKAQIGIGAGQLVDELGLKGSRVGAAEVSPVHANFIVNRGGAKAGEVLELIEQIQARARAERGVELETEVQIIGTDQCEF